MTEIIERCGFEFLADGKDHVCVLSPGHLNRHKCDCGDKEPKNGVKRWAFKTAKSRTQIKAEKRTATKKEQP